MNCKQAEIAMMEQMEKTIQPARAKDLAQHVLDCENCREYYIGFDMALDVLSEPELNIAPANFTQNVMAKVREMPVHSPPICLTLRILWGMGAIFLGVALLFAFNPEWLTALTTASPAVSSILAAMESASTFATETVAGWVSAYQGMGSITLLHMAIVFVGIMGGLLVVLQRQEKGNKA